MKSAEEAMDLGKLSAAKATDIELTLSDLD